MADTNTNNNAAKKSDQILGMNIDDFLDADILNLLGADNMPPEEKDKIYKKMVDTITNRVILKIDDLLKTDENRNKFKKLLDANDNDKISQFLTSCNIDVKQLIVQETLIYKTELVALAQTVDENKK